jgi:hypothetical protein
MTALALIGPAAVLLLVIVGAYELLRQKRRKKVGTPLAATYVNEVTAMFYGTKRMELDHRDSVSMMRDEEAQGGPPADLDLDSGTVTLGNLRKDPPVQPS